MTNVELGPTAPGDGDGYGDRHSGEQLSGRLIFDPQVELGSAALKRIGITVVDDRLTIDLERLNPIAKSLEEAGTSEIVVVLGSGDGYREDDDDTIRLFDERLKISDQTRTVKVDDKPINLTESEFNLLLVLAQNQNRVITRQVLYEAMSGYKGDIRGSRAVDVHVRRLRQALAEGSSISRLAHAQLGLVVSVRGKGYRWNPDFKFPEEAQEAAQS